MCHSACLMMNRLQLYICKSLRGFRTMLEINPSEAVRPHINDVRDALENIDYAPENKYLFYLIRYIGTGALFTIIRTIPDRPLDHLACTLYVPAGLKISREQMASVVHQTTRIVSNPAVSPEDLAALQRLFARDYPLEADAEEVGISNGREYAFCYYGGDTGRSLDDFFGAGLFKPDFEPYAGVLLVDSDLDVTVHGVDLSRFDSEPASDETDSEQESGQELEDEDAEVEDENVDVVTVGYSFKWLVYVAVVSLLIGVLLGWLIFHGPAPRIVAGDQAAAVAAVEARESLPEPEPEVTIPAPQPPEEKTDDQKPAEPVKAEQPTEKITAEAIAYLDGNKKWTRAELEKHPSLHGLYDDMNSFNINRLTDFWGKRLSKSKEFARVAHHAAEGARKKVFKPSGTYNRQGEESINVQSYLNRIDPAKN